MLVTWSQISATLSGSTITTGVVIDPQPAAFVVKETAAGFQIEAAGVQEV